MLLEEYKHLPFPARGMALKRDLGIFIRLEGDELDRHRERPASPAGNHNRVSNY